MSETTNTTGGEQKPVQKKTMMIIICLFAGGFGIHRFMMGYKNWWLQLLLTILCGVGIFWVWYDLIMIITGKMKMADGRELEA
jgi:TM2 domain-containing membrane protein YozV